jgi:hypothetical protein
MSDTVINLSNLLYEANLRVDDYWRQERTLAAQMEVEALIYDLRLELEPDVSKERAKGTRFETSFLRDHLKHVYPDAQRTGSNHSSEWLSADYLNTEDTIWEVKDWKDWTAAIKRGWNQVMSVSIKTGKTPYLAVHIPRGPTLVITTAEEWVRSHGIRQHG